MENSGGLRRVPMLRLLIPQIMGILLQWKFNFPLSVLIPSYIIVFISLIICFLYYRNSPVYKWRWVYGVVLSLVMFLVSSVRTGRVTEESATPGFHNSNVIIAEIAENPGEYESGYNCIIRSENYYFDSSVYRFNVPFQANVYFQKDSLAGDLKVGDRLLIKDNFTPVTNRGNPNEFDNYRYNKLRGIFFRAYVPSDSWIKLDNIKRKRLVYRAAKLQEQCLNLFSKYNIEGRELSIAGALVLGAREHIERPDRQVFAAAGAVHLLAVSGLHVGILYLLLIWVTILFKPITFFRLVRFIIIISGIWFYAILTGLSPSVIRSAIMFSFVTLAQASERETSIYNTLAASAAFQLFIDPLALFSVGFQLSYLAVFGIVYFHPKLVSAIRIKNKFGKKIWQLSSVSIAAQLITFPLSIYYFNQLPNYFLLTNLFAIPLVVVILYSGFGLILFAGYEVIATGLAWLFNLLLECLIILVDCISGLPFSHFTGLLIPFSLVFVLYGLIYSVDSLIKKRNFRFLFISIMLLIVLFGFRAGSHIRNSRQNIFVVYNMRNEILCSFIAGRNHHVLISGRGEDYFQHEEDIIHPEETEKDSSLPYEIEQSSLLWGANQIKRICFAEQFFTASRRIDRSVFIRNNFIFFAGKWIFFPVGEGALNTSLKPAEVDFVVLSDEYSGDLDEILMMVHPKLIILDSTISFYLRDLFIKQCRERDIDYHDVITSGAFISHIR